MQWCEVISGASLSHIRAQPSPHQIPQTQVILLRSSPTILLSRKYLSECSTHPCCLLLSLPLPAAGLLVRLALSSVRAAVSVRVLDFSLPFYVAHAGRLDAFLTTAANYVARDAIFTHYNEKEDLVSRRVRNGGRNRPASASTRGGGGGHGDHGSLLHSVLNHPLSHGLGHHAVNLAFGHHHGGGEGGGEGGEE